jgi:hypothetical protein
MLPNPASGAISTFLNRTSCFTAAYGRAVSVQSAQGRSFDYAFESTNLDD